jgi:hypothetical protein
MAGMTFLSSLPILPAPDSSTCPLCTHSAIAFLLVASARPHPSSSTPPQSPSSKTGCLPPSMEEGVACLCSFVESPWLLGLLAKPRVNGPSRPRETAHGRTLVQAAIRDPVHHTTAMQDRHPRRILLLLHHPSHHLPHHRIMEPVILRPNHRGKDPLLRRIRKQMLQAQSLAGRKLERRQEREKRSARGQRS